MIHVWKSRTAKMNGRLHQGDGSYSSIRTNSASMRRMRIVHYSHTNMIAGAERVLLNVLPYSSDIGLDPILLSPAGRLQDEVRKLGIAVTTCHSLQARYTWNPYKLVEYLCSFVRAICSIRHQLRDLKPDLVHANSVRAGLVATAATVGLNTPVVWHVHDVLPSHPFSHVIRIVAAASRRSSFIAVSKSTGRLFAKGLLRHSIASKMEVLHNAVASHSASSTIQERSNLRKRMGVSEEFLIGCVGQVCQRKNQVGLVEVFAEALKSHAEMVLLIAGSALFPCNEPYEKRLHQRVRELGISDSVRLLGNRDDIPLLLETMDLLVIPSKSDPFPMIMLESMVAGLPIVAYAVDGIPELVADGRTGWLVPPNDRMQLARTILWAERNPAQRRRLAEGARHVALANSLQAYASTFANILRSRATQSRPLPKLPAIVTEGASQSKYGAA